MYVCMYVCKTDLLPSLQKLMQSRSNIKFYPRTKLSLIFLSLLLFLVRLLFHFKQIIII